MNKEKQIEIVKELRKITNIGLIEAKRILSECNWDINKAIKYIRDYPTIMPPMDYWRNKKYCYCSKCEKFYVVYINCDACKCGSKF